MERLSRWIDSSLKLSKIEPFMIPVVQGLGRLDIKLIHYDQRLCKLLPEKYTIQQGIRLTNHMTQSYLWVLGAYELVRSIDQRCRSNPDLLENQISKKVNEAKHKFERVRIPLAKFEPSLRNKDGGGAIAFPSLHREVGASWHIGIDYISRKELSDTLLDLLETI